MKLRLHSSRGLLLIYILSSFMMGASDISGGGCGTNNTSSSQTFTVGGTVSGISGTLVLQNNGGDNLTLTAEGSFTFTNTLADGATYEVTVLTNPDGQTCTVSNGNGTISAANISNVSVTCTSSASTFDIGGTVSGLDLGKTIGIQNNGDSTVLLSTDGPYFYTLDNDTAYSIAIATQPSGQTCTITGCPTALVSGACNGTASATITDLDITCVLDSFNIGGTISGLGLGETVVIQNNGGSSLLITEDGPYFYTLDSDTTYTIEIATQPSGQTCTITSCPTALVSGACTGTVSSTISDIDITCIGPT